MKKQVENKGQEHQDAPESEDHLNEDAVDDSEEESQDEESDDDEEGGLFEALQRALNQEDGEEEQEEETEVEESEEEEVEEQEEETSDEEEELENQDGTKPTRKTSEFIRSLKQEITDLKTQLSKAQEETSGRTTELEEENRRLKEEIDTIAFTESDDFKNRYVKPLQDLNQNLGNTIKSNVSSEDIADVEAGLKDINLALGEQNEAAYFKAVDGLLEYFGPSVSRRISNMLDKVWEVTKERSAAESDLKSARENVVKEKISSSNKAATMAEKMITDAFASHERSIQQTVELYRKPELKDKFKYDEITPQAKQAAIDGLKHFANTGELSPQLQRVLVDGIMGGVHLNERNAYMATIKNMEEALQARENKVKSLQSKLKKMGVSSGSRASRSSSGDDDGSGYGIADAMASLRL